MSKRTSVCVRTLETTTEEWEREGGGGEQASSCPLRVAHTEMLLDKLQTTT